MSLMPKKRKSKAAASSGQVRRPARQTRRAPAETGPGRSRDGEATKARILEAAADLFAAQGFDATSTHAIAAEAGYTVGAIYRHFTDKSELLLAVVKDTLKAMPIGSSETKARGGADSIADLVLGFAAPDYKRVRRLSAEVHAAAAHHKHVAALLLQYNARMTDRVAAMLTAARPGRHSDKADAERTAKVVLLLILGVIHLDTLDPQLAQRSDWHDSLRAALRAFTR
jgi:AcrR family transcriptional regulator